MDSEAFNILRTEMQLGYSVGAFLFPLDNIHGIALYIQGVFFLNINFIYFEGSKNSPDKNDMIIESKFLETVHHILNDMPIADF